MSSKEPLFVFFGTPHFATVVLDALEAKGVLARHGAQTLPGKSVGA